MDGPLEPSDLAWLDDHVARCAECRAVPAAYAAQRAELRAMRTPLPPRDLWARTSAALDAEEARHGRVRERRPARSKLASWAPLGALGSIVALFVVGFLVGSQVLPGPTSSPPIAFASGKPPVGNASPSVPIATPIAVPPGPVAWCSQDQGSCVIQEANVDHVCPPGSTSSCAPIDAHASSLGKLNVTPKSIVSSPDRGRVIVVGSAPGSTATTLFVVSVGGGNVSPPPSNGPTAAPTSTPPGGPSGSPIGSSPTPAASVPPASATPESTTAASSTPAGPSTSPALSLPPGTPAPTALAILSIATNVVVVGESAAFSPDGAWFAFSAHPAGSATGPDIYVWHAGDPAATPVTTDHGSVFSGWVAGRILGSRPSAPSGPSTPSTSPGASPDVTGAAPGEPGTSPSVEPATSSDAGASPPSSSIAPGGASSAPSVAPAPVAPSSFLIDPATKAESPLTAPAWRPIVDPTGRFVIYWQGTISADASGERWVMGTGRLVLASWPALLGTDPSATLQPSALPADLDSADGADWDAQWDATGEHLAVWIGERDDPKLGHLDLLTINPTTGRLDPTGRKLAGKPALAGFSLRDGHLAWATPPGQDGQGSRLQVYAWSG
ncbi:MAG: hypothetical protein E6I94_04930, partial [Chloroflexi bacterium]